MKIFKKVIWVSKYGFLMALNTMVWLNFSLNPSQAKKWHFFTFFPEKNDFFTQFDMYFRLGLKIGVFDAFKYDGVGAIKLKPFPSEKKCIFCHFLQKNENFQKSDMGIKIWVFDAAEYDGAVEFSLKPLTSEKIAIFYIFSR